MSKKKTREVLKVVSKETLILKIKKKFFEKNIKMLRFENRPRSLSLTSREKCVHPGLRPVSLVSVTRLFRETAIDKKCFRNGVQGYFGVKEKKALKFGSN